MQLFAFEAAQAAETRATLQIRSIQKPFEVAVTAAAALSQAQVRLRPVDDDLVVVRAAA